MLKCTAYVKDIYLSQSYLNYFPTYQFGVIEKTSVQFTNVLAFLWDKGMFYFAIILKLGLSV